MSEHVAKKEYDELFEDAVQIAIGYIQLMKLSIAQINGEVPEVSLQGLKQVEDWLVEKTGKNFMEHLKPEHKKQMEELLNEND